MAEKIELDGLQESMNQLAQLSQILSKTTDEFLKTAEASSKFNSAFKSADNLKDYNSAVNQAIEVNQKMTLQSKSLLEVEQQRRKSYEDIAAGFEKAKTAAQGYTQSLSSNVLSLAKLQNEQKKLRAEMKELETLPGNVSKKMAGLSIQMKQNQEAIRQYTTTIRNQIKEQNTASGSINDLRAKLNQLTQTYDELSKTDRDSDIGKNIRNSMKDLSDELKVLEGETGRFQRNVGNYPQTFGEVGASIKGGFKDIMNGNVQKGLSGMSNGIKGVAVAGRALIATPLGVVLAAIAAAVMVLTTAFKAVQTSMERSEERSDKLKSALAPFKGLITMLVDLFGKLGGIIIDLIVPALEAAVVAVDAFFKGQEKLFRYLGWDKMADGVKEMGDRIKEATRAGEEQERLQQRLTVLHRQNTTELAKVSAEMAEQREIARDETKGMSERIAANEEVYKLQRQITAMKREELMIQLQLVQADIRQGDHSTEKLQEQADILAQLTNLRKEDADAFKRNNRVRKMLSKEQASRQKELADAERARLEKIQKERIAMDKALLDNFILTNENKVKFDEKFTEDQLQNYRKFVAQRAELEQQHLELVAGTTYEKALTKRTENRTAAEQELINNIIKINQQAKKELEEIDKQYIDYKEKLREKDLKTLETDLKMRTTLRVANGEDAKQVERDYYNELHNLRLSNFEDLTGLDEDEIMMKFEQNELLTELERNYVDEVISQRKRLADWKEADRKAEIKAETDKQNQFISSLGRAIGFETEMRQIQSDYNSMLLAKQLEDETAYHEARLHLIGSTANMIAGIMGKETVFGKALLIAQVAMDTAAAVMRTWATMPERAAVLTPIIIGMGVAQAVKIATTQIPKPPKFATGVSDSKFSGAAIVDEKGAEIHLDKNGNIKTFGSDKGARLTNIEKGDTIVPAHISKSLLNVMPTLSGSMLLNGLIDKKDYDFKRLEQKISNVEKAIKNKENKSYIQLDENFLIEVTERNGSTYQRAVRKMNSMRVTQSGLN